MSCGARGVNPKSQYSGVIKVVKMPEPNTPVRLYLKVLHYINKVIGFFGRFVFKLYYGKSGESLPPIVEGILKEPAVEIADKIRNKKITSVEVVETFIRRIRDVNFALNCFVEDRFTEALREANEADELVRGGTKSVEQLAREKPFLGVPFTTKDCIAVKGLHNTAGLMLRKDVIAEKDALCIHYLREAGAIPLGLTNVPEFCMWWETHNHIHGRTCNPYNTTRIVGGSSGGEGCMQAAAGSAFGIGSDIGGSIRMPAFFNGVFGHKPSKYIVSNDGQFPDPSTELQSSFLGLGPLTRHAEDLKPLLKIMAGDNKDKLKLDDPVDISSLKIYYQKDNLGAPLVDPVHPEIKEAMKKAIEHLASKVKTEPKETKIERLYKTNPIWFACMKDEVRFAKLITGKDGTLNIVMELVKNLFGCSGNTLIGLLTALFDEGGVQVGSEKHKHFLKVREELEKLFKDMLKDNGVFFYPTHPTPAPYHNEPVLHALNLCYTSIINCLGLPATHIPLGLSKEGLPIGIQVVADTNNDRLCLAIAEELEKAFGGWVEPRAEKNE